MTLAHLELPDPEPELIWKCHQCGTTGTDDASINQATHVTEDRVYLRPHCDGCLPAPSGQMPMPVTGEWQNYNRASQLLSAELSRLVEDCAVHASTAHKIPCPVCGLLVVEDLSTYRPVYAVEADRDESECLNCLESRSGAEIADARRRRAQGIPCRRAGG